MAEGRKNVVAKDEVYEELVLLRDALGLRSLSDVIRKMLDDQYPEIGDIARKMRDMKKEIAKELSE